MQISSVPGQHKKMSSHEKEGMATEAIWLDQLSHVASL
jgi:hypothetical protein